MTTGSERHHVARGVARLQRQDVFDLGTERRVRLRDHAIRAAETVEVVHVQRAEIDLQRLEDVGEPHVLPLHFHAIDVHLELGHVDLVAREYTGQRGLAVRAVEHILNGAVERFGALIRAILDSAA